MHRKILCKYLTHLSLPPKAKPTNQLVSMPFQLFRIDLAKCVESADASNRLGWIGNIWMLSPKDLERPVEHY